MLLKKIYIVCPLLVGPCQDLFKFLVDIIRENLKIALSYLNQLVYGSLPDIFRIQGVFII